MSILIAVILGIIQGLTEFLPVSSSGHLMVLESLLGVTENNMFYNILLHVATLMAVVIIFWKDVVNLLKHPFGKDMQKIYIATIPTIVIALLFNYLIDDQALNVFVGFGFLISGLVIGLTAILNKRQKNIATPLINNRQSFIVGLVQGLAVLPGISRSGSTICAGLLQGVSREESARFSFIISIPVILGGMVFEIAGGIKHGFGSINLVSALIGFAVAFAVALLTIKLMMKIVKNGNWWIFSIYLFIIGTVVVLNQFVFGWF